MPKILSLLAALACGALLPLTLAPFDWWPLGLVSIGGWFWLLNRGAAPPCALGFAYGLGKFGVGVSWVYVSIHTYGNASPPLAALLVLIFVAGLSLFTLAHARLYAWLRAEHQSDTHEAVSGGSVARSEGKMPSSRRNRFERRSARGRPALAPRMHRTGAGQGSP